MAALRATNRLQVGSTQWIKEERSSALQIADSEVEEFAFSAHNELDWLNEHMAEIFSNENNVNMLEAFKTPGRLRGKTPRTVRKRNPQEGRAPLSDIFSSTQKPAAASSPFRQQPIPKSTPSFQVAEDAPESRPSSSASHLKHMTAPAMSLNDSGYHGSQMMESDDVAATEEVETEYAPSPEKELPPPPPTTQDIEIHEDEQSSREDNYESAEEEDQENQPPAARSEPAEPDPVILSSPVASSPEKTRMLVSPQKELSKSPQLPKHSPAEVVETQTQEATQEPDEQPFEDQSASDGSSPVRAIVRKSSLNFPSLPAREPLATKKSIGARTSSQIEPNRTSYYGRTTGGKSLGVGSHLANDEIDSMDLDIEDSTDTQRDLDVKTQQNKTSTQRLQDQISMLGKLQHSRASKSIANSSAMVSAYRPSTQEPATVSSSQRSSKQMKAPGAFPEDDDDWLNPHTRQPAEQSPRPQMAKAFSADIVEGIHGKDSVSEFNLPKKSMEEVKLQSPVRGTAVERTKSMYSHTKAASTSVLQSPYKTANETSPSHKKTISVSNPSLKSVATSIASGSSPKSPPRSIRESPLKSAKDKLSSILKSSKGLFASSAAVVAEGEKAAQSPTSTTRFLKQHGPSLESLVKTKSNDSASLYPTLRLHEDALKSNATLPGSPTRSLFRKTRASTEREEKQREKEAREKQKMADELEKAREKEREKARVFSEEKERVAAMEKKLAAHREQEKLTKAKPEPAKPTRVSPRRAKEQVESQPKTVPDPELAPSQEDLDMTDAVPVVSQTPSVQRPTTAQSLRGRELKRPNSKLGKDIPSLKAKTPVVIRVNTGSQHPNQYHPSNSTLAASLGESLAPSSVSSTVKSKGSASSLHSKQSTLNRSINSVTGKPKALEAAARKRELEEREAQRKREARIEMERKRAAAAQEEEKRQEQRRVEAEQQRQREREPPSTIEAKKAAQRQAIEKRRLEIERAKQQRAPPPAARPPPNADTGRGQEKPLSNASSRIEPPTRPGHQRINSILNRSQDEVGRAGNTILPNPAKAPPKRPIQQDVPDEAPRTVLRTGHNYQQSEQKRRRTSEGFNDDFAEPQVKSMAPPVRQSAVRPKDGAKSFFSNGYATVGGSSHSGQLLQKPAMHQGKGGHPLDMTQTSKAPIMFASGMSSAAGAAHKTPARPAGMTASSSKSNAKSAAKSSPRIPNTENIELPEIHTDSEDDDSEGDGNFVVPDWANSPAIRAQLVAQDSMDPSQIFGPIAPLQMEEVFKNKDRWHRFRGRTSSANWSGADRLTEDEIRKDLEAREKLRREGKWTYGLS